VKLKGKKERMKYKNIFSRKINKIKRTVSGLAQDLKCL